MDSNIDKQVLLDKELIHLNHAGVGPWLKCTVDAITAFSQENARIGSLQFRQWEAKEMALREQCRQLLNANSVDDIAFLKNTSEGLSLVAYGFPWQPGDNVVFAQQEFPSNRIVWEAVADHYPIEARRVDLDTHDCPETALVEAIDNKTRIVAVSAVQYADGLKMDLPALSAACRQHNSLLCCDAIQALGIVPFDVQAQAVDIAIADAHKWLLAPEGIAVFYISSCARKIIRPMQFGWHNIAYPGNYQSLEWEVTSSARRYECGSLNNLGIAALHASLQLLLDIGIEAVYWRVRELIEQIITELDGSKYQILTSHEPARGSGILTIRHRSKTNQQLYAYLLQNKVLCAQRGGGIRLSPHFYTNADQICRVTRMLNHY